MDFKDYINLEIETINEFINQLPALQLNELKNESFSTYDFTFYSADTPNEYYTPKVDGICEVKTRQYDSLKYGEGALIELGKLTNIAKEVSLAKDEHFNVNKTIKGFYLMKYTDRTFLFDLESIELGKIQFKKCPKSTANSKITEWINKAVVIIPYDKAILSY